MLGLKIYIGNFQNKEFSKPKNQNQNQLPLFGHKKSIRARNT